jgi:hypothetical protein
VTSTKLKLLFFLGPFVENGEDEDCTATDPIKTPPAPVQLQGQTPAKSSQQSEAGWFLQHLGGKPVCACAQAKISCQKERA